MAKSRTQKAALNVVFAAVSQIVSLICGLILPRLILKYYGSAYNGITSSATQFLSMIDILNLGVAGATRSSLYKTLASGDIEGTSRIVKTTEKHMRKIGLVLLVYIVLLSIFYPLCKDTGFSFWDVSLLIIATGISTFANYFFGATYQSFLSADQCVYISDIATIISIILNTVVSVILIFTGCSIQVVKLGSALAFCAKPILQNIYVNKKYGIVKTVKPDKTLLKKRYDVMAHSIANIVHENTDVIVLTVFCDIKIVSVYTVYNFVMFALKKMQKVFTTGTEAIFGNMWAKGEIDKIKNGLNTFEYLVSSFVSIVFSITWVMILPFVSLYTQGVTDVEYIVPAYAMVATAAMVIFSFRTPYITLVQGVGQYKETRNGAILEAVINIVLSVVFVQFMGIVGVAVGTLVANLFRTCQYAIHIEKKIVQRGKLFFARKIVWAIFNMVVIILLSSVLGLSNNVVTWFDWVVKSIIVGLISIVITLVSSIVFFRKDFFGCCKLATGVIKKK